jgi:hypothetical protein
MGLSVSCTQRDAKNSSASHSASVSSTLETRNSDTSNPSEPEGGRPALPSSEPSSVSSTAVAWSPPTHSACRILAIGDSLTDPRSHGGGFLTPWVAHCPACQVTNIGRGGAMINQMLSHLRRHLNETPETYTHWVVFGGVNDLYSDQTAKRTLFRIERDLSSIYALGHSHKSVIVAIGVAPWGGFRRWYTEERGANTATLNQWIREQKTSGAIDVFVDSVPPLTCGSPIELCPELASPFHDGLHFGPEGHRKLGTTLLDALGGSACGS